MKRAVWRCLAGTSFTRAPALSALFSHNGPCSSVESPEVQARLAVPEPGASSTARAQSEAKAPHAVQLRDYQEECIQSVLASLSKGQTRLGISLATGSGKTVIFTQLISRIPAPSTHATQTLILAHRRELVEQAARHCQNAYPDARVEMEMGPLHASGTADITIASVQSLTSGDRLARFDPARFKLVLVDEAHHVVAPGYLRVLAHFHLVHERQQEQQQQQQQHSPVLVGVSATFSRFDGLRLGAAIDEIVYHRDYVSMIGDKWLSDVMFTTVVSAADLSRVRRSGAHGDFLPGPLSRAVNTPQANELVVRSWLARAAAAGRKSTLVFCVDRDHVSGLARAFREHGVDARSVTAATPKAERGARLDEFKRGGFPVLVNCGVFTEGTDIPNIDCVVLARPTRSRNLLVQMMGRGMRLSPGKKNCHVIDMVSSLETGIVTTPTLFGLDPGELLHAAGLDDLRKLRERDERRRAEGQQQSDQAAETQGGEDDAHGGSALQQQQQQQSQRVSVAFTEYDSVLDLIADTSGEKHIRTISQYAWVQVGAHRYVLSGPTGTFLRLEKTETQTHDMFTVWEVRALPAGVAKSPYAAPRQLLEALSLPDAVHGADKYAKEVFPHMFVAWRHRWRDAPPTQGQLDFLNKVRGGGRQELTAENVTKGRASDMITKIKHGARGRFADLAAGRRRTQRREFALGQERERAMREIVAVGPVPG